MFHWYAFIIFQWIGGATNSELVEGEAKAEGGGQTCKGDDQSKVGTR